MLRISGIASGIDTESMVKQMMMAQRIPVDRMVQQRQVLEWQRDSYRELNSAIADYRNNKLTDFRLQGTFMQQKVSLTGDTEAISAIARNNALAENMTIRVHAMATSASKWGTDIRSDNSFDPTQRLNSQASKLKSGTPSQTIYNIKINGHEVRINTSQDSLADIMVRISRETNVSAFYDEVTGRVSFQSKETGTTNGANDGANISFEDDGHFLANVLQINTQDNTIDDSLQATNAVVSINGMATIRTSNSFSVSGIDINLLKATGEEVTINAGLDTDHIVDSVKRFIEEYNEMLDTLQQKVSEERYRDFPPLTEEQKNEMSDREIELWEEKAMSGLLRNDRTLESTINIMRRVMTTQVEVAPGEFMSLSSLGITTGSYNERGKLYLRDEEKLRTAIEANADGVVNLFTKDADNTKSTNQGIGAKLYSDLQLSINELSQKAGAPSSMVLSRTNFIGRDIINLNQRIDDANRRLLDVEDRYYRQFTAMERALEMFHSQSMALANMLGTGQQ